MDIKNIVKNAGLSFVGWFLVFAISYAMNIFNGGMLLFCFGGLICTVLGSWGIEKRQASRNFPDDEKAQKAYLNDAGFQDTALRVAGFVVALVLAILFSQGA